MKKLKSKISIFTLTFFAFSCGDAGFGFDVTADYPVPTPPIVITTPNNPLDTDMNPDLTVISYSIDEVGAFADALDDIRNNGVIDLDKIQLRSISYEILGVDASEQVPLDEITVEVQLSTGSFQLPLASGQLQNIPKTVIPLSTTQESDILQEISQSSGLNTNLIVDIGIIPANSPAQNLEFEFKLYFDILLSVRNL